MFEFVDLFYYGTAFVSSNSFSLPRAHECIVLYYLTIPFFVTFKAVNFLALKFVVMQE